MELYSSNENYKLYHGNMLDMLEVIEPNSIDAVITDPPYELNFMGKGWDNSGIAFQKETWQKCYEVLKSGGYLLAFGGSRTFHRIACAIEDAGFEIRDTIMWLYGSGFPKSMNIGLAIDKKNGVESKIVGIKEHCKKDFKENNLYAQDEANKNNKKCFGYGTEILKEAQNEWKGWGTALKPSFEPIIIARKPFKGSLVDNVIEYGVGGINIDECRVGSEIIKGGTMPDFRDIGQKSKEAIGIDKLSFGQVENAKRKPLDDHIGRFPANTILTYDETDFDEVCGGFPNTKNSKRNSKYNKDTEYTNTYTPPKAIYTENNTYGDSGSASRYFYCAKASKKDRDEGLDEFEEKPKTLTENKGRTFNDRCAICGKKFIGSPETICHCDNPITDKSKSAMSKNIHPTVKPTELCQYLIRLVSPNGATILDPFNGSGSTGKAAMYENYEKNKNYKYIGIELTEEYLPISKARIEYVCNLKPEIDNQLTIFDFIGDEK